MNERTERAPGLTAARTPWRRTVRRRILVAGCAFAAWIAAAEARLAYLQVGQRDMLVERARKQHQRTVELHPKRGDILDRHGRVLAWSVEADTIYAVPAEVAEPEATADALCAALDDCSPARRESIVARLGGDRAFAYVKRRATPDEARRVAALGLQGIGFLAEDRRYYPNGTLAAHLLGYVGVDNQGLGGIESTFDDAISGNTGQVLVQTDARRRAFSRIERPPTAGAAIELTIDAQLQYIVERELRAGIAASDADAGAAVMLDPHTGEVLALASEPTFNPNFFAAATADERRNRAVQDLYEPGSTFKVVTASAAIEERVVDLEEIFDVSAGAIVVGGDRIPDFTRHGPLTFKDVIVKSSNVGAILIGLRLGPERLSRYVRRFGFGRAIAPDFPSESPGLVSAPETLTNRAIASISMGYQVAVTSLQMAAAVAAVANGGELLQPRLLRAISRPGQRETTGRHVIRRAISRATAARLAAIMHQVVERGTGRRARVPGYAVAGKTGTAEKLIDGEYSDYDHYASFVGFAPVEDPRMVLLVMLDTPRTLDINGVRQRAYTGGAVAAPIFQRIASVTLRRLGVPSNGNGASPLVVAAAAPVESRPVLSRPAATTSGGVRFDRMSVSADASPPGDPSHPSNVWRMPDLRGLSAREAVESLGRLGLGARVVGDGTVARQDPPPNRIIEAGGAVRVWLDRHGVSAPVREAPAPSPPRSPPDAPLHADVGGGAAGGWPLDP